VPALRDPSPAQHRSLLDALAEYLLEGLHTDLDVSSLTDVRTFAHWIAEGTPDAVVPERDRVPHRILWWVDGPEYLGRLRLNLDSTTNSASSAGTSATTSGRAPGVGVTPRRCWPPPWSSLATTGSRRCC